MGRRRNLVLTLGVVTTMGCSRAEPVRMTPKLAERSALEVPSYVDTGKAVGPPPKQEHSAPAEPFQLDNGVAFGVAASWLSALAMKDPAALVRLSAPDLSVTGFSLANDPDLRHCGDPNATMSGRAMQANATSDVVTVLECVVRDAILVGSVPGIPAEQWSQRLCDPDRHRRSGYLRPLDLDGLHASRHALPARLHKYRSAIASELANGLAFSFYATDGGGSRAEGVIIVQRVADHALVSTVFIDEEFRC